MLHNWQTGRYKKLTTFNKKTDKYVNKKTDKYVNKKTDKYVQSSIH